MPRNTVLCLVLLAVTAACADGEAASPNPFALVEVFTSEGCSSCPPADDYINSLARKARGEGEAVYLLAWHVDYWNTLKTPHGVWADPFSSAESTKRQRRYGKALSSNRMYTPQILVDAKPFRSYGKNTIGEILQDRLKVERSTSVSLTRTDEGVDWSVTGAADGSEILVALVQRDIRQHVDKGENRGRDLEHENVVRWHRIARLEKSEQHGSTRIDLPGGVPAEAAGIIAVVQTTTNMTVQTVTGMDW